VNDTIDFATMWNTVKVLHSERQSNIQRWRNAVYRDSYRTEPLWEGGSDIQIPLTYWCVETIHDRLFLSQFGVGRTVYVKSRLEDADTANALERILNFYHRKTKKHVAIAAAMRDALLLGCGVVRIDMRRKRQRWGTTRVVTAPVTEYVPLENFFLSNPFASLEEQSAVFHQYFVGKHQLSEYDPDLVAMLKPTVDLPFYVSEEDEYRSGMLGSDTVRLVDVFYKTDEGWRMAVFAPDDGVVLKDIAYAYPVSFPPFFLLRFTPIAYGVGLASVLEPFEKEITALHNQRIDNNTLINLPIFKVLTTSPALRDKETWFAGKKIPVDTPEDITPLQVAERVTPLQDEIQILEYAKLVTGISEILSGQTVRGEKTAFEIEVSLAEGSVKFRKYIYYVTEWLKEQAQFELLLLKRWGDSKEISNIVGGANPFDLIVDDDLLYRYELEANTTLTNKDVDRQKWILLRNLLSQEPSVVGNPTSWYEVLKQILIAFDVDYRPIIGEQNVSQPPPTPPPLSPEQISALGSAITGAPSIDPNVLLMLQNSIGRQNTE